MIELLDDNARRALSDTFENEFHSVLPPESQANIVAVKNDAGEIEAFVVSEVLIRVGMWWMKEEIRNTAKAASHVRALARYILDSVPADSSIVTFAEEDTHKRIYEHLGMRPVEGQVYRIDL